MPPRKLSRPGNDVSDRRSEPKRQTVFSDVIEDEAPSTIPEGTLAKCVNCIPKGNDVEPRNGSILYTSTSFPTIDGRSGYTLTKNGFTVTSAAGIFVEDAGQEL